jgi:hypothetical protein
MPRHPWRVCLEDEEIARADLDAEKNESLLDLRERIWALLVAGCAGKKLRGLLLRRTGRKRDGLDEFQRAGIFRIYQGNTIGVWRTFEKQSIVIV